MIYNICVASLIILIVLIGYFLLVNEITKFIYITIQNLDKPQYIFKRYCVGNYILNKYNEKNEKYYKLKVKDIDKDKLDKILKLKCKKIKLEDEFLILSQSKEINEKVLEFLNNKKVDTDKNVYNQSNSNDNEDSKKGIIYEETDINEKRMWHNCN